VADRKLVRLAATLLFTGVLFSLLVGVFHADRADANDHAAAFAEYAASRIWTAVHLGQSAGMTLIILGLLALFFGLNVDPGPAGSLGRFGVMSVVVSLSLYGVLQAVDGVALKQAVDAWVGAPEAEGAARFAGAEAVRWLEWGVRSYQSFILGLSLILFGIVIVWTARIPKPVGYLMGVCGLAYLAHIGEA